LLQGDIRSEMYIIANGSSEIVESIDAGVMKPVRLVAVGEAVLSEGLLCKVNWFVFFQS